MLSKHIWPILLKVKTDSLKKPLKHAGVFYLFQKDPAVPFCEIDQVLQKILSFTVDIRSNTLVAVYQPICKSSHQWCSMKKGVLRNFTKFTGKHLC